MSKQFDSLANKAFQTTHVLIPFSLILISVLYFGLNALPYASGIMLAWATFKEGYWDHVHEDAKTRGNGWVDWAFYWVGIVLANAVVLAGVHQGHLR